MDAAHLCITDTSRLLQLLKSDNRAIFTAAAKANQAVAYLKAYSAEQAVAA